MFQCLFEHLATLPSSLLFRYNIEKVWVRENIFLKFYIGHRVAELEEIKECAEYGSSIRSCIRHTQGAYAPKPPRAVGLWGKVQASIGQGKF